jgi:hypothetical protein
MVLISFMLHFNSISAIYRNLIIKVQIMHWNSKWSIVRAYDCSKMIIFVQIRS